MVGRIISPLRRGAQRAQQVGEHRVVLHELVDHATEFGMLRAQRGEEHAVLGGRGGRREPRRSDAVEHELGRGIGCRAALIEGLTGGGERRAQARVRRAELVIQAIRRAASIAPV